MLSVLVGAVGTEGGTSPNAWSKYLPHLFDHPPAPNQWNELHWPLEYPLTHYEMSFLLPHFLREGRGKIDVYFTRVFNPVWTYPDGFTWIEALSDDAKIGLHCWHQKCTVERAHANDQYGDVYVDTEKSHEVYKQWLAKARPAPGPGGLRRPLWMNRPLRPAAEAFYVAGVSDKSSRDAVPSEQTWYYMI